jgi:hypothetical protein
MLEGTLPRPRSAALRRRALCAAALLAAAAACSGGTRRAAGLYNQGKYAEACPLLKGAYDAGRREGTLLYQIGYCREVVDSDAAGRQQAWTEAEPVLEKEVKEPRGATLERLYYLTVINANQSDAGTMRQYGLQGVEQFEKGPDPNALGGEDWFRIGRLHDFLQEESAAEAAYRRALSAFEKTPAVNPSYRALVLIKVGDMEYRTEHYELAAKEWDEARAILPGNPQISPFRHAVALLASKRYADAAARFADDRDAATATESQYGADLAKKIVEVAPLDPADKDGTPFGSLGDVDLEARIRDAAKGLRAVREKNSMKPGDPLPAEVALDQKRFVALLSEYLTRHKVVQDFCLQQGIADLVRR